MDIKRLWRYREAAQFLGIALRTLRSLVHRKQIPHIRLSNRLVLFDAAALGEWLQQRTVGVLTQAREQS